ncbi:MAG: hypothetical protein ACXABD_21970 [Candidatus Thorarchaeota archaeon]|jgi:hypothetical protein
MIIKDSDTGTRVGKFAPVWNSDGQKVYSMVALTSAVAKVAMTFVPTDSGMGCFAISATDYSRYCIPLETVASGEYVDCVIEGYVPDVSVGASGKVASTAMSTFTRGDSVFITDTGTFAAGGATWDDIDWTGFTTAAGTTAKATVGIALSSGETATFDLWLIDKGPLGRAAAT